VKNTKAPYYYSVGGRVKLNESCEQAIKREVQEELGISMEIDRAVFFYESFFVEQMSGERFHEIAMFFLMKPALDIENVVCRSFTENGAQEMLHWIDLDELDQVQAFPSFFATELRQMPSVMKHIVEYSDAN
ncbi:MAG: NUDIX hydrolase, partial [Cellulosilyticaceae bacterium]